MRRKRGKTEERKEKTKERKIEVRKVAKEWEIWDEEAVKLEKEAKKLVPAKFHKWIHVFRKKANTCEEAVGSCNRYKGGICAKEGKGISIVKGRAEGGA